MPDATIPLRPDAGFDDNLEPGTYAAIDGLALAGPAPDEEMALAALRAWLAEEGHDPLTAPTLFTISP